MPIVNDLITTITQQFSLYLKGPERQRCLVQITLEDGASYNDHYQVTLITIVNSAERNKAEVHLILSQGDKVVGVLVHDLAQGILGHEIDAIHAYRLMAMLVKLPVIKNDTMLDVNIGAYILTAKNLSKVAERVKIASSFLESLLSKQLPPVVMNFIFGLGEAKCPVDCTNLYRYWQDTPGNFIAWEPKLQGAGIMSLKNYQRARQGLLNPIKVVIAACIKQYNITDPDFEGLVEFFYCELDKAKIWENNVRFTRYAMLMFSLAYAKAGLEIIEKSGISIAQMRAIYNSNFASTVRWAVSFLSQQETPVFDEKLRNATFYVDTLTELLIDYGKRMAESQW